MDVSGIENYEKGALKLEIQINDSLSKIDNFDKLSKTIEAVANTLKSNATRISEYVYYLFYSSLHDQSIFLLFFH